MEARLRSKVYAALKSVADAIPKVSSHDIIICKRRSVFAILVLHTNITAMLYETVHQRSVMGSIFCRNCGRQLDESFDPPCAERIPCPDCGSTSRRFEELCVAGIRSSVSHSMLHQRESKTIGFEESGRQGRTSPGEC